VVDSPPPDPGGGEGSGGPEQGGGVPGALPPPPQAQGDRGLPQGDKRLNISPWVMWVERFGGKGEE